MIFKQQNKSVISEAMCQCCSYRKIMLLECAIFLFFAVFLFFCFFFSCILKYTSLILILFRN